MKYSLIIPIFKSEMLIEDLLLNLTEIGRMMGDGFEVVFVVDGSPDDSHDILLRKAPQLEFNTQVINLSRNFGSFSAIRVGLEKSRGEYVAVATADLQEPNELIQEFFESLEEDQCDLVIGQRSLRSDGFFSDMASNTFWWFYRRFVVKEIPEGGVDVFGCNRQFIRSVLKLNEPDSSLIVQLFWVGYRRKVIRYERKKRTKGKSTWTLRKKIVYMLDSIFSFSDLPIFLILIAGVTGISFSLIVGAVVFTVWAMGGVNVPGYTPIMLSILFFGSASLFAQGLLGAYVWRTFNASRKRPLAIVSEEDVFSQKSKETK